MSNLHSRPDSRLFERLHRVTVSLADVLRPLPERARRMLHARVNAMRPTIRHARALAGQRMRCQRLQYTPFRFALRVAGQSPWVPLRMIAAIVAGRDALQAASFGPGVMAMVLVTHQTAKRIDSTRKPAGRASAPAGPWVKALVRGSLP